MPTDAAGNVYNNRIPNTWMPKRFAGLRYYDTPIFRPLWPFFVGTIITIYGVVKIQKVMMNSEQYYNDPRHPRCMAPSPTFTPPLVPMGSKWSKLLNICIHQSKRKLWRINPATKESNKSSRRGSSPYV